MKKLILAVVTTLLATLAYAQPIAIAKVGAQFSRFSSDGSESILGIRGGVGKFIPLGESSFFLMPQAVYAMKGQEAGEFLGKCRIHYAEVPVSVGAMINFSKKVGLGLMVGPYASFGVAGKSDNPEVSDVFGMISRFDAGISAGIQFHIWKIFVFADYDYGLRNLMGSNDFQIGEKFMTRSGAVGVGFAY